MTTRITPVELSVLETLVRLFGVMVEHDTVRDRYAVYYNEHIIADDDDLLRAAESAWVVIQAHRALLGQPPFTTLEEQREAAKTRALEQRYKAEALEAKRQRLREEWYLSKKNRTI